ncbi:MAG: hypothetical protein H6936_05245 [Burkholderiales bacterium]|nr:hypothetical protein [Nitrosomonas sp.]MCP5274251.1 hypothetical protein [Burkholderiales bacterium]
MSDVKQHVVGFLGRTRPWLGLVGIGVVGRGHARCSVQRRDYCVLSSRGSGIDHCCK